MSHTIEVIPDECVRQDARNYFMKRFGSLKAASEHYGVSVGRISHIQMGNRPVPDYVLKDMGYERVTVYKKREAEDWG